MCYGLRGVTVTTVVTTTSINQRLTLLHTITLQCRLKALEYLCNHLFCSLGHSLLRYYSNLFFLHVGENSFKNHDPNSENKKRRKHPRMITFA